MIRFLAAMLLIIWDGFALVQRVQAEQPENRGCARFDSTSRSSPSAAKAVRQLESRTPIGHREDAVVTAGVAEPFEMPNAWWLERISDPNRPEAQQFPVTLDSLLVRAVSHSSKIKVFSELPLIRETSIVVADAAFDWHAFVDSKWNDTNDPVGNTLVGAFPRYKNQQLSNSGGLRRRTLIGGNLEASQQVGFQNSNSIYLNPNPQSTTRLALSYTQPLMRGAGQLYNKSLICLAEIETKVAETEFSQKLQEHLLEVTHVYWALHAERANVVIRQHSLNQARDVTGRLKERESIDTVFSQIQRSEAEVATRESELLRSHASVRNAEARLRSLINDPELGQFDTVELIPLDTPTLEKIPVSPSEAMSLAIISRPEIHRSLEHIKAGATRLQMASNEMLPILNATTQAYVAGLAVGDHTGDSLSNQFTTGNPSYTAGLQCEMPIGNRAGQARRDRRLLECRLLRNEYETTLKTVSLEVGIAVREIRTSYNQMLAQSKAVRASTAQLEQIENRWKLLSGEDENGALVLNNMLLAQARRAKSETAYVSAWIKYNLALIDLKRTTGDLLQHENVTWTEYREECEGIKTRVVVKPQ